MKILRFLKHYWWLVLSFVTGCILFNYQSFIQPFLDAIPNFQSGQFFQRYSSNNPEVIQELLDKLSYYADSVINFIRKLINGDLNPVKWTVFLVNVIKFLIETIRFLTDYALNVILIFWIFILSFLEKKVLIHKTTRLAKLFIQFQEFLAFILFKFISILKYVLSFRREIAISICIVLFFKGFLFTFIIETLTFLLHYILSIMLHTTFALLFSIIKSIIILVILYIPVWLIVVIMFYLFFSFSKSMAINKLERNYVQLKMFVKHDLSFATIIYGVPNIGKTRLMTNLGLACEEGFIEDLEDNMHDIEMDHPDINWGQYDMTRLIYEENPDYHVAFLKDNFPMYLYYGILLYKSGSMIASAPYSINDPYSEGCSVIFDWDWVRMISQKEKSPIEPYKILVWSELDKEYNSHDDKETVSEDGVHLFFGTGSHQMERYGKIFGDYQSVTQVPLRLRSVAEYFLHIQERVYKYPFFLGLFKKPFERMYRFVDKLILGYESFKLKLMANTRRTERRYRKRFDYTLFYSILRFLLHGLKGILGWFELFGFNAYHIDITDSEMKTTYGKIVLRVNLQDEVWRGEPLYHSTFLKDAYQDESLDKIKFFIDHSRWASLPRYGSIKVTREEMMLQHSHFLDKAFNLSKESTSTGINSDDSEAFTPKFK